MAAADELAPLVACVPSLLWTIARAIGRFLKDDEVVARTGNEVHTLVGDASSWTSELANSIFGQFAVSRMMRVPCPGVFTR